MEDEEEILQKYGTPLELLKEDEIPAKKPISIEDQIVRDENGKRRFHGAFTGGFSAGFWNTVGSLEGWKPSEFKSSRGEKAPQRVQQRPEDFMDDEDLGEFGIAPQRIQAQSDFQIEGASNRKRKLFRSGTSGVIPGSPLLAELLLPVEDKIAVRILKSMGWKPGQGIGPRLTSKQKRRTHERNKREEYVLKRYGCLDDEEEEEEETDASKTVLLDKVKADDNEDYDDDHSDDDGITFAPDDYDTLVCMSKTNRFGLGYSGLSYETSGEEKPNHFNLFGPLEVADNKNKRLTIQGQAFGVGALEEEDEDIYAGDNLTKYDFSLEEKVPKRKLQKPKQNHHIIDDFGAAQHDSQYHAPFLIEPPAGFQPRNWSMRKSRFAPLPPEKVREMEAESNYKRAGLGRHDINPTQRSAILEDKLPEAKANSIEQVQTANKRDEQTKSLLDRISSKIGNFTRGGLINTKGEEIIESQDAMSAVKQSVEEEQKILLAEACTKTAALGVNAVDKIQFKPFLSNAGKQDRYEKFLTANLNNETEIAAFLTKIQPVELSEFDREIERKEFMQARRIYKPLAGFMSQRFVSEAALAEESSQESVESKSKPVEGEKKIEMKRSKEMWRPHPLLCKRYNIAEPFGGHLADTTRRKTKSAIFDYLETSVNRRDNFQTPVIIPKRLETPKAAVNNRFIPPPPPPPPKRPAQDMLTDAVKLSTESKMMQAPQSTSSSTVRAFKLPPKSDLEKRVEESRDKPPCEKVELFRAIFEDSDDELETQAQKQNSAPAAKIEIEKLDLPTTKTSACAAEIDLNKVHAAPRGMFATFFSGKPDNEHEKHLESKKPDTKEHVPPKITFKSRRERQQEIIAPCGPSLPEKLSQKVKHEAAGTQKAMEARLMSLYKKHNSSEIVEEVWVERTVNNMNDHSGSSDDSDSSDSSTLVPSDSSAKKRKKKSKKAKKQKTKDNFSKKTKKAKKHAKTKKKFKKKKDK